MLQFLIFLFLIFFVFKKNSLESFTTPSTFPNVSNMNLKDSLNEINQYLIPISTTDDSITHFCNGIEKFNYFLYNNSKDITVLVPINSTIEQYFNWILTDLDEFNKSPNIINNCFILGNIFNQNCIFDNGDNNCGPFDKNKLLSRSNGNLENIDFIMSDIYFKDGIIHLVDFLLENTNDKNLYKKNYFREHTRQQRIQHITGIASN